MILRLWHPSNLGFATGESCPDCGAEVLESDVTEPQFFCSRKLYGCEWSIDPETTTEINRARKLLGLA